MMTEDQMDEKYELGTPWWRKAPVERFVCNEHGQSTIFMRDNNLYIHADIETECK
jgi:hypothetical protein